MKQKILYGLYFCEIISAILYYAWFAPQVLAVQHLELEISYPILLMIAVTACFVLALLVSWITRKKVTFLIKSLGSLLIWAGVLFFIGMMTECPVCGGIV